MTDTDLTIDARGLACPGPVLRAKKALDSIPEGQVQVLVDEAVARENVSRLAAHMRCSQQCEVHGQGWRIMIDKPGDSGEQA